jgi:meiotically up-regulated gene 157 (Mug157) protein
VCTVGAEPACLGLVCVCVQPSHSLSLTLSLSLSPPLSEKEQRDSTNQVWPYLRFASKDAALQDLIAGLIHRQAANVLQSAYANAYQINASKPGPHTDDFSFPNISGNFNIFEYKWELDSLANVLRLSAGYYAATADASPFDAAWLASVRSILATMTAQQKGSEEEDDSGGLAYAFSRTTSEPSDSLEHTRGPVAARTGMVKCAFRGSDDAVVLPFNIPENAFAAAALSSAAELLSTLGHAAEAAEAALLSQQIRAGIEAFGTMLHPVTKEQVYACEWEEGAEAALSLSRARARAVPSAFLSPERSLCCLTPPSLSPPCR